MQSFCWTKKAGVCQKTFSQPPWHPHLSHHHELFHSRRTQKASTFRSTREALGPHYTTTMTALVFPTIWSNGLGWMSACFSIMLFVSRALHKHARQKSSSLLPIMGGHIIQPKSPLIQGTSSNSSRIPSSWELFDWDVPLSRPANGLEKFNGHGGFM